MELEHLLLTSLSWLMQLSTPQLLTILFAAPLAGLSVGLGIGKVINVIRGV